MAARRALCPQPSSRGSSACAPLAPAPLPHALAPPPSGPHTSPGIARPAFDSAGRDGFRPATELQHVQRHEHGKHVRGALRRACALPPEPSIHGSSQGDLVLPLPPSPASRPRTLTSPRIARSPFDLAGRGILVRRQQAAHPLRMGGHRGLRPYLLWRELGSGDLLAELKPGSHLTETYAGSACVHGETRSQHPAEHVKPPNRNLLRKCVWRLRKLFGQAGGRSGAREGERVGRIAARRSEENASGRCEQLVTLGR